MKKGEKGSWKLRQYHIDLAEIAARRTRNFLISKRIENIIQRLNGHKDTVTEAA